MRDDADICHVWDAVVKTLGARPGRRIDGGWKAEDQGGVEWPVQRLVSFAEERQWVLATLGFSAPAGVANLSPDLRAVAAEMHARTPPGAPRVDEFELTMRIPRAPGESGPPPWGPELLLRTAARLRRSIEAPDVPSIVELLPAADMHLARFGSCLLTRDVDAPVVRTTAAPVTLVQAVALFRDETEAALDWTSAGFAGLLLRENPGGVSDPARVSLVTGAAGQAIRAGVERDGSGTVGYEARVVDFGLTGSPRRLRIVLPIEAGRALRRALVLRVARGKVFVFANAEHHLVLQPGADAKAGVADDGRNLMLMVPREAALALATRLPQIPALVPWPEFGDAEVMLVGEVAQGPEAEQAAELEPRFGPERRPQARPRTANPQLSRGPAFIHGSEITALAVSPDGARVATGGEDGILRVWDAATGRNVAVVEAHAGAVEGADFAPDGVHLLTRAGEDNTVALWRAADAAPVGRIELTLRDVDLPVPGPDGRPVYGRMKPILAGKVDHAWWLAGAVLVHRTGDGCEVWDPAARVRRRALPETSWIQNVALSPDRTRVAARGQMLALVDVATGAVRWSVPTSDQSQGFMPHGLLFAGDGRLVVELTVETVRGLALTLRALHAADGREAWSLDVATPALFTAVVDAGPVLAVVARDQLRIVDAATGVVRRVARWEGHPPRCAVFAPATGTLWTARSGEVVRRSLA